MSSGAVTFGTMASSAKLRELLLEKPPEASFGQRRLCGCVVWQFIFFYNVFCACVSFSIVMPSLFLYLDSMGATASFYALVVAAYSFGEAIGSIALGSLSNSFGIRHTLLLCTMLSFTGACLYGLAATAAGDSEDAAAQHGGGAIYCLARCWCWQDDSSKASVRAVSRPWSSRTSRSQRGPRSARR